MKFQSVLSQEPAAQVARLEVYIAWALSEVAALKAADAHSPRIRVLLDNVAGARDLLLELLAARAPPLAKNGS